jgi:hypothetical protein
MLNCARRAVDVGDTASEVQGQALLRRNTICNVSIAIIAPRTTPSSCRIARWTTRLPVATFTPRVLRISAMLLNQFSRSTIAMSFRI